MSLIGIKAPLRDYLLEDAAVAAAVGTRIFPGRMPQGEARTSIVITEVSGDGDHTNDGPSGLTRQRVQIDSWSSNPDTAADLARAVKERIDGLRGVLSWGSSSPQSQVTIRGVFFDSSRDLYDDTVKMDGVSQDFFIWYAERA